MTQKLGSFPFLLCILDGLAHNPNPKGNAVAAAKTPTIDRLMQEYSHTELKTFGQAVGLPDNQMGNSEVGHLNIGAGRVVEQDLTRINNAVRNNSLAANMELSDTLRAVDDNSALHFIGLVSTGGVHSSIEHLQALMQTALAQGVKNIFVHAITDGRDRPQTAAEEELLVLENFIIAQQAAHPLANIAISTIIGRYYAMDRDKRWDRIKKGYDLFTLGVGEEFSNAITALKTRYQAGQTDEFLEPIVCKQKNSYPAFIRDQDTVIFFNFRADRMRQLVPALTEPQEKFTAFERSVIPKLRNVATLTEYDEHFNVRILFGPPVVRNHLGEVFAKAGLRQLRIAETEKYAHVTYFFNGGVEDVSPDEFRVLVPSPRDVPTYDFKPAMSAIAVTEALIEQLNSKAVDVVILNFANCDMVGHTGVFEAAVKAVETVDGCLGRIIEVLLDQGGSAIVTADHGNADQMIDYETGEPHTFHTKHPVPCIFVGENLKNLKLRNDGALANIAPTICQLLGLEQPSEMASSSLIL